MAGFLWWGGGAVGLLGRRKIQRSFMIDESEDYFFFRSFLESFISFAQTVFGEMSCY